MTEKNNTYRSISCSYYDQLEAYATKRTRCSIIYRHDGEKMIEGVIIDLFSKHEAEYLKMDNGIVIRLDYVISINGNPVSIAC